MSLTASIYTSPLEKPIGRRIAEVVSKKSGLTLCPRFSWFRRTYDGFELPEVHNMLTEMADWDCKTWDMDKSMLPSLARVVEELAVQLDCFTFRVAWVGEKTLRRMPIDVDDLAALIRCSKIENRVEYVVGA